MFIPTIYLSPTCPFMTSELLASVCQSGKSSLANASLLASRFGKNRHCWKKMLFPTAVFESGPVWTKYFLRLSCDPFFQTRFRCRFINCWCWYFANNSAQEAEKWTFGSTRPFLQTRNSVKQFKEAFCTSNTCSGSIRGSDRYSEVKLSIAILCELIG